MSRIFVRGLGAVSPAGWGSGCLLDALRKEVSPPTRDLPGPDGDRPYSARPVPMPSPRPAWMANPRLRRASVLSQYAVGAALEALAEAGPAREAGSKMGIVAATHTASIRYSERFYGEVLKDPSTASPMLFPETVINAPVSHLAAVLGNHGWVYSVIGDQTAFVQALRIAGQWLLDGQVEECLVVGLDEAAWSTAHALRFFSRQLVLAEGAGALWLSRTPPLQEQAVVLEALTDSHGYAGAADRSAAARRMRQGLPPGTASDLLVDARCGVTRVDRAETAAWAEWQGQRLSPRRVLGEGLCAATAWQFVAACAAVSSGSCSSAMVSVVGGNQEAVGARIRLEPTTAGPPCRLTSDD